MCDVPLSFRMENLRRQRSKLPPIAHYLQYTPTHVVGIVVKGVESFVVDDLGAKLFDDRLGEVVRLELGDVWREGRIPWKTGAGV